MISPWFFKFKTYWDMAFASGSDIGDGPANVLLHGLSDAPITVT